MVCSKLVSVEVSKVKLQSNGIGRQARFCVSHGRREVEKRTPPLVYPRIGELQQEDGRRGEQRILFHFQAAGRRQHQCDRAAVVLERAGRPTDRKEDVVSMLGEKRMNAHNGDCCLLWWKVGEGSNVYVIYRLVSKWMAGMSHVAGTNGGSAGNLESRNQFYDRSCWVE